MKPANKFISTLALIFSIAALAGCSKPADEKPADAQPKAGVTIDAETQARIGLKIETPVAMQWQPDAKGYGRGVDPATLTAAVADLGAARAACAGSSEE